ncbi:MAG: GerAB/ArcD/ProY family transporter [Methanomassiliicoccales archaeon]
MALPTMAMQGGKNFLQLEKGSITGWQLTMLITGFVIGSASILPIGGDAKQSAWLAVLLGMGEALAMAGLFVYLARRFPGHSLIEINVEVFGVAGILISLFFIWFLLHLGSLVLTNFVQFFSALFYPETPEVVFAIVTALVCVYAVYLGIEALARCSLILVPLTILLVIFNTIMVTPQMELKNLLPLMDIPLTKLLWAGHSAAAFPFGETVAFLMIMGAVKAENRNWSRFAWGLLIPGIMMAALMARNTAVLGETTADFVYPSLQVLRLIDVGEIFSRVEAVLAINFLAMGFIKVSVLLYGCALGSAQLLKLQSYRPLVMPIGLLMAVLSLMMSPNTPRMTEFAQVIWPLYSLPFELGIPLLLLLGAVVFRRKQPAKGERSC